MESLWLSGHRSVESEGLRFDSSWGLRIFSLSHARDKTKNPSLNHVMQKREEGKARWLNLVACLFTLKGLLSCFCLFVCFVVRVVLLFRIDGATDYSLG